MEFQIGLSSVNDSNSFLRALWAELRTRFGSLYWQFNPVRIGERQVIKFGYAQVGDVGVYRIAVSYREAGCITSLFVEKHSEDASEPEVLRGAIEASLKRFNVAESMMLTMRFGLPDENLRFHNYVSDSSELTTRIKGTLDISLRVRGYDATDVQFEYANLASSVLDQIACWTNCERYLKPILCSCRGSCSLEG